MVQESKSGASIQSLSRAFRIMATLREQDGLTLTELANRLEMPTSTAHVYLQTLRDEGFVVCEDHEYRNGLRFLEYGSHVRQQYEIYEASKRVLRELAVQTGERAGLGVEENGKRVLLHVEDGTAAVSDNAPVGEYTHMHWTALGKTLLAYLPSNRRDEIIANHELPCATEKTITDPDALRRELAEIRQAGYAMEEEEHRDGIRSVCVPVLTPDDTILGAIGLTGPISRFDGATVGEYIMLLEEAANVVKLKTTYY
jgi:DNA-binding IclR family transcriptional regulator